MFHVKHRSRAAVVGLIASTALLAGCASGTAVPHGWAPPVAGPSGLLLVQSAAGKLAAVQPNGTHVAEYELKGPTSRDYLGRSRQGDPSALYATPVVDGDTVYVASYKGRVVRLRLENNAFTAAWDVELHENVVATPILRNNRLYVSAENGDLIVLDAANGKTVSTSRPTDGRVWGSPGLSDSRLFIGTLDSNELLALNINDGTVEWRHEGSGATAADLVTSGGQLLVASFDRTLHALDMATGAQRWQLQGDGWFVAQPLVRDNIIYTATMRGSVYALTQDGQLRWKFSREGLEFRATPILVNNTLIVADRDGEIIALDAANSTEKWTRTVDACAGKHECLDAHGLLLESGIFYVTADHRLVRVDPASGDIQTLNAPSPSGDGK